MNAAPAPIVIHVRLLSSVHYRRGVLSIKGPLPLQLHVSTAHQLGAKPKALPFGSFQVGQQSAVAVLCG